MAKFDFWALGEASVTVSGGGQLDGVTQGDGSHLMGLSITLTSNNWESIAVKGNNTNFDDNGTQQKLDGDQTFDGVSYSKNTDIEAEYQMTLRDPATGIEYQAIAVNFQNSSPSYATIEGIAFIDTFPPVGVALTVVATAEGPGDYGQPSVAAGDLAIPCFTPGTMIDTPDGPRAVQELAAGDLVTTLDHGAQPLRWVGHAPVSSLRMALHPELCPIRIKAHAFGCNHPNRDMLVSPQHRILIEGWRAEMLFGEPQVLVAAKHLINDMTIQRAGVAMTTYIHLQCDAHEVLISDGLATESFNPGPVSVAAMPDASRAELQLLFPDCDLLTRAPLSAARPLLGRRDAALLIA